jgi:ketosteroid isomerase-like protein
MRCLAPTMPISGLRDVLKRTFVAVLLLAVTGCATSSFVPASRGPEAELAGVRKQLEDVHGSRDAVAFGALHTVDTVFDWRGRSNGVTNRAALEKNRREVWQGRRETRLALQVSELQVHTDRAYEFGSYEETWIDAHGSRVTEFGRYVLAYARERDGQWRIARTVGYSDLTARKASE